MPETGDYVRPGSISKWPHSPLDGAVILLVFPKIESYSVIGIAVINTLAFEYKASVVSG